MPYVEPTIVANGSVGASFALLIIDAEESRARMGGADALRRGPAQGAPAVEDPDEHFSAAFGRELILGSAGNALMRLPAEPKSIQIRLLHCLARRVHWIHPQQCQIVL